MERILNINSYNRFYIYARIDATNANDNKSRVENVRDPKLTLIIINCNKRPRHVLRNE